MARGSKRKIGNLKQASFGAEVEPPKEPVIDMTRLARHLNSSSVSVSLRYFRKQCECFSDWEKAELKMFAATLEKLRGYSANALKTTKSLCDRHKASPDEARFSLPGEVSPELSLYEIKVDPSNKLRAHGFFEGQVFFLLWLDRKHACFTFGKKN